MSDKKHFSKSISPACMYCRHSREISGGEEYFCIKKGSVEPLHSCRSYVYDPLRRTPQIKTVSKEYKPEDFKL